MTRESDMTERRFPKGDGSLKQNFNEKNTRDDFNS